MSIENKAYKKPKKNGRPSKINDKLITDICNMLRAGNYIETACAVNGIPKTTLYDWLKKGRDPEARRGNKYKKFLNAVEKAMAEAEARDVINIGKACENDWKASAWRLERKYPDRWAQKQKIDMNANVMQGKMSEETEKRLQELMELD